MTQTKNLPAESRHPMQPTFAARDVGEIHQLGQTLASSGYFPDAKTAAQAVVKVLAGREMGFAEFVSMAGVHVIEGKPTIGAHLLASAIKRSGKYDYKIVRLDRTACELQFLQLAGGQWKPADGPTIALTLQEFIDSGVAIGKNGVKDNWKRNPDDMLFARAISKGYRRYCPDLSGGLLVYTTEEMDGGEDNPPQLQASPTPATPPPAANGTPPAAEPPAWITEAQESELAALVRDTHTDIGKLLGHYRIHVLSRLPAADYVAVKERLLARKAQTSPSPAPAATPPNKGEEAARKQVLRMALDRLCGELQITAEQWAARLKQLFGTDDGSKLTLEQLQQLQLRLEAYRAKQAGATA